MHGESDGLHFRQKICFVQGLNFDPFYSVCGAAACGRGGARGAPTVLRDGRVSELRSEKAGEEAPPRSEGALEEGTLGGTCGR